MWEFISQSIAGLFDPLYIALVIFVSQFFFRYVKSGKIHDNKPRFVLILGTLIAFSFLSAHFIMGDSIPNLIHYAVVLFLNFCFSTTGVPPQNRTWLCSNSFSELDRAKVV